MKELYTTFDLYFNDKMKYQFRFIGYSEAANTDIGVLTPQKVYDLVLEVKDWKAGKNFIIPKQKLIGYAASSLWEPINKVAKDLMAKVDPDHLICSFGKSEREHFAYFHATDVKEFDRIKNLEGKGD